MRWIGSADNREQLMQELPAIGGRFLELQQAFFQLPHIPAAVLELCRLRLAQLHGSEADFSRCCAEVDTAQRDQLTDWPNSAVFSDAERACLEMTEVHAIDVGAITDAQADAVKAHFGEKGLVALIQALGTFDGYMRLGLLWSLPPEQQHGH